MKFNIPVIRIDKFDLDDVIAISGTSVDLNNASSYANDLTKNIEDAYAVLHIEYR